MKFPWLGAEEGLNPQQELGSQRWGWPVWGLGRGCKSVCVGDGCGCRRDGLSIPCRCKNHKLLDP